MKNQPNRKAILAEYNQADSKGRALLERLYGTKLFSYKITDRVYSLEDAFEETGRPTTPEFIDAPEDMRDWFKSLYNGAVYAEALNEGWVADYKNGFQKKHLPYFHSLSSSGFAFYETRYVYAYPGAGHAARLCLKSSELAEYVGKEITDVYEGIITK